MANFVVYRITNIRNRRIYIGSTSHFEVRKAEHLGQLRTNKHCNRFLQRDFNDFKEESFVFEIIADHFKTRDAMLLREYELILKATGKCYNIDTNCPVVNGTGKVNGKKGRSVDRKGKLLYGAKEPDTCIKKRIKGGFKWIEKPVPKVKVQKIKTEFPKLDAIIERRKQIEANKAKHQKS